MQQVKDHIAGFFKIGKKWDIEKKEYVDSRFGEVYLYATDQNNEPIKLGTKKLSNGMEVENYQIAKMIRIPLSTLSEVALGKKKRCMVFYTERPLR